MALAKRNDGAAMAARLLAVGDWSAAIDQCRRALAKAPRDASALHVLGGALLMAGRHGDARQALNRAVAQGPACPPEAHCELATLDRLEGKFEDALERVEHALRLRPGDPRVVLSKVELLTTLGRYGDAAACVRPFMRGGATDPRIALAFAGVAEQIDEAEAGVDVLRPHALDTRIVPAVRATMLFRLARLLDSLDRCAEAFDAASQANGLKGARFDAAGHARAIDLLIERWSAQRVAALPLCDQESELPVFIVGVPRSGTSLVEQILSSHPAVFGADERPEISMVVERAGGQELAAPTALMHRVDRLTPQFLRRASDAYLEVVHGLGGDALRVTDKRPDNFLHIGLISRMLPRARVIHCIRDPRDVALSCFMRSFHGPYPWACSLDGIAAFHRDYERLMAHWRSLPGVRMHEVRYEDLVASPEPVSRELVGHIGLPWDDACLRPHECARVVRTASAHQVRKPIYRTSAGRWRRYERELAGLAASMGMEHGAG